MSSETSRAAAPDGLRSLVVFHVAEISGAALSLRRRLEWLASIGPLQVVSPGPGPAAGLYADLAATVVLDYEAMTLPAGPGSVAPLARRTRREVGAFRGLIRRTRPDLVVCVSAMLPAPLIAARLEGVPALVHAGELLALDPTRRPPARAGGWLLARLNARLAAGIAACSQTVAREYAFASGLPLAVTYPPIEPQEPGDGAGFRERLGIDPGAPLVAALGSISRRRGQDVLARAMLAIRRGLPDARCVIVGDPFPRASDLAFGDELERLRQRLGLTEAVHVIGFQPDVASVYAAADVVVNPARVAESFGRVACEALLAGTPVVSSNVGAVPEVLRDGETALLVDPDRPAALADAALSVLRDGDLARRLAKRGADDVRERFGPDAGLEQFEELVATVTGVQSWPSTVAGRLP